MNNDNDLNLHSMTKLSGWLRYWPRLVSEENSLHVRRHAFSRPVHAKSLFLDVRQGILIKLLIKATTPILWLRVVYALFGSLASLKIIPLVAPGINVYVFFNRIISHIQNKFKPPGSDRGFLFEGFFQKFLHFHLFLSSLSDLFSQQLIYLFWLWLFLL